ncbi:MAG: class I SAM-dependent methyltransferase [Gammaproteobacteria bacterium]|nr:class I SAM-dependent methyltransferase [Gammaproteobacteria bacterium]
MERDYQYGFAAQGGAMYDLRRREQKAHTMMAVLSDYFAGQCKTLDTLTIGGSTGIIDNYLAQHFRSVTSIDIDAPAIAYARATFQRSNLEFLVGDAMQIPFGAARFDVVICSQVYEHVPDAGRMFAEILRVLKPGGVCYFAANNRLMLNEPHYNLPLLSVMPRPLAHLYIRLAGKAPHYYEKHLSYWGLTALVARFVRHDYTRAIIEDPRRYAADYMLTPGSRKAAIARFLCRHAYWLVPGYIWLLEKPGGGPLR